MSIEPRSGWFRAVSIGAAIAVAACGGGGGGGGHGGGGGGGSAPVTITVTPLNNQAEVRADATLQIDATVSNASNPGVTWRLSGTTCPSNNCGSLSSNTGNSVLYTPPPAVAASFSALATATSVQDPTKSASVTLTVLTLACPAGSESMLKGLYAFLLRGADSGGTAIIAGSFTANGSGNITGGSLDQNRVSSGPQSALPIQPSVSTYSVGPDRRGCLTLTTSNGTTVYRFALGAVSSGVAGKGRLIEFDKATGSGTSAEGFLRLQDAAAFTQASLTGTYAFGLTGEDFLAQHTASVGVISASGAGALVNGQVDTSDAGTMGPNPSSAAGTYGAVDSNGRTTMTAAVDGGPATNWVLYVVSAKEIIALSMDPRGKATPMLSGEFVQQAGTGFSPASLNAKAVFWTSGFVTGGAGASVSIGLITADGNGNYSMVSDVNQAGAFYPLIAEQGTYTVAASGRATTTTTLGRPPSVLYLIDANRAFVLSSGPEGYFGRLERQDLPAAFGNDQLSGTFFYGTEAPHAAGRLIASGTITFDGSGSYAGTEDDSTPGGLFPAVPFSANYSFSANSSVAGRGALDQNNPPHQLAYAVSPSLLVYMNTPAIKPRVVIVEK
jgi:hypothetical protein